MCVCVCVRVCVCACVRVCVCVCVRERESVLTDTPWFAELLLNETLWRTASAGALAFARTHYHPRNLEIEVQSLLAATGL